MCAEFFHLSVDDVEARGGGGEGGGSRVHAHYEGLLYGCGQRLSAL